MAARRLLARQSLADFACMVDIPTVPISDVEDEDRFSIMRLDSLAKHHALMCEELQAVADGRTPNLMLLCPPGSAKALALDTPIPTPTGWRLMGDLRVGDEVFDEGGRPCRVTWVSPIWKDRPVYAVTTDCGDRIVADRDHEWRVRLCGKPRRPMLGTGRGRQPLPNRDDPASQFKIKETHALHRRRAKRPMIERARRLDLPDADLPIDPYVLGVWLGDGSSAGMRVTSSIEDQPWLRAEFERLGIETRDTTVPTLFQVIGQRGAFVSQGLLNDPAHNTHGRKHIPAAYLRASADQRLALLQGLIDTDGTVCRDRGCTTFCNTNLELAEAVRELVRSLGVKAGWTESRAMLNGVDHGPVYRVGFYLKDSARMPRKAALTRDQHRTPNTYIDVVPDGIADTVCIEVDSPSHLFLCGRSMTPTHNSTYTDVVFVPWFMAQKPRRNVILASYATGIARKQGRRARQLVKSRPFFNLLDCTLSTETSAAEEWALSNGSEYMAGGLLSGLTGNRAALGIVDDPVAGREEAESETISNKTWDAYIDDFCSRLIPGAPQVMILTRWSDRDLAGRILPDGWNGESGMFDGRDGRRWKVLCLPAIADRTDDPLGRKIGETLWPEWFNEAHWAPFKTNARTWASLYQQKPSPDEGTYFRREWFDGGTIVATPSTPARTYERKRYAPGQLPKHLRLYGTSDYAVTEAGGDWTVHRLWGVDSTGDLWLLPGGYRAQATSDNWIEALIDLMEAHKPFAWFGEAGVIQKAVEPALLRRMKERKVTCRMEWVSSISDKPTRARGFQARAAMGTVHIPEGPEGDAILEEYIRFPAGKHDDDVDNGSMIGRVLDMAHPAIVPPEEKPAGEPRGINEMTWDQLMAQQGGARVERI